MNQKYSIYISIKDLIVSKNAQIIVLRVIQELLKEIYLLMKLTVGITIIIEIHIYFDLPKRGNLLYNQKD